MTMCPDPSPQLTPGSPQMSCWMRQLPRSGIFVEGMSPSVAASCRGEWIPLGRAGCYKDSAPPELAAARGAGASQGLVSGSGRPRTVADAIPLESEQHLRKIMIVLEKESGKFMASWLTPPKGKPKRLNIEKDFD